MAIEFENEEDIILKALTSITIFLPQTVLDLQKHIKIKDLENNLRLIFAKYLLNGGKR